MRPAPADDRTPAEVAADHVYDHFGESHVNEVRAWATSNVPPAELAKLNARFVDPMEAATAFGELRNRMRAETEAASRRAALNAGAFRTTVEMERAIADAERRLGAGAWNKDPELMKRIAVTPRDVRAAF